MRRVVVLLTVLASVGCSVSGGTAPDRPHAAPPPTSEGKPETRTRGEMRDALMGKTRGEVLGAVGRPDRTEDGEAPAWVYRHRAYDPVSRKVDPAMFVYFGPGGTVTDLSF